MKHDLFQRQNAQDLKSTPRKNVQFLSGVAAGVSIATALLVGAPVYAQTAQSTYLPTAASLEDGEPLELSCVPQGDKFLCEKIEVVEDITLAPSETNSESSATTETAAKATTAKTTNTADASEAERVRVANLALAIAVILFGGVMFNTMLRRRNPSSDAEQLERQIELLERIWHKSSSV